MYGIDFHKSIESEETPQANRLVLYLKNNMCFDTFYDFGCSSGIYLREIKEQLPAVTSTGFEFSEEAVSRAVCPDVTLTDLTVPLGLAKRPNTLGLCLEVLEHIDDSHWKPVLENVTSLCDTVVFSAALPGQGGTGHINCRPRIDWIQRFHSLGWMVDLDATEHLVQYMNSGYRMGWLVANVIVFVPINKTMSTFYKHYF